MEQIIIGVIAILVLITMFMYTLSRSIERRQDNTKSRAAHVRILLVGLGMLTFTANTGFVVEVLESRGGISGITSSTLALVAFAWLLFGIVVNLILVLKFLRDELRSPLMRQWFSEHPRPTVVFCVLALAHIDILALTYSEVFLSHRPGTLFCAPLSSPGIRKLSQYGLADSVFQDLPMLALQIVVFMDGDTSMLLLLALGATTLSLMFGLVRRCIVSLIVPEDMRSKRVGGDMLGPTHPEHYSDGFGGKSSRPTRDRVDTFGEVDTEKSESASASGHMVSGVSISMKNGFMLDSRASATPQRKPPSPRSRRKDQMRRELAANNDSGGFARTSTRGGGGGAYHSEKELVQLHSNASKGVSANSHHQQQQQQQAPPNSVSRSPGRAREEASRHPTGASHHPIGSSRNPPSNHFSLSDDNTQRRSPHANTFQNGPRRPKQAPRSQSARALPPPGGGRSPPHQQFQKSKASSTSQLIDQRQRQRGNSNRVPPQHMKAASSSATHHLHAHERLADLPTLSNCPTDEYRYETTSGGGGGSGGGAKNLRRPERAAAVGKGGHLGISLEAADKNDVDRVTAAVASKAHAIIVAAEAAAGNQRPAPIRSVAPRGAPPPSSLSPRRQQPPPSSSSSPRVGNSHKPRVLRVLPPRRSPPPKSHHMSPHTQRNPRIVSPTATSTSPLGSNTVPARIVSTQTSASPLSQTTQPMSSVGAGFANVVAVGMPPSRRKYTPN